ncbi:MAG TPA: hypothetical protein VIB78_01040 [Acidimicrobiia bacterium]
MRLRLGVALVGTFLLVGPATPALADPATPTNYRSEVTEIDPPTSEFSASIVGGDSFLQISVPEGTEVEVLGYQEEPYVRVDPAGTVWANRMSPAFYLNDDRYGQITIPHGVSPESPPDWVSVGVGGRYAWHDHRIHWMSPVPPPGVAPEQPSLIQEWTVPLTVEGELAEIRGTLSWVPSISPMPWVGLIALLAVIGSKLKPLISIAAASLLAISFGLVQWGTAPVGAWSDVVNFVPPLVAFALLPLAFNREQPSLTWQGAAVVLLLVWSALRFAYFTLPVLPIPMVATAARAWVAIAMGATLAGAWGMAINTPLARSRK